MLCVERGDAHFFRHHGGQPVELLQRYPGLEVADAGWSQSTGISDEPNRLHRAQEVVGKVRAHRIQQIFAGKLQVRPEPLRRSRQSGDDGSNVGDKCRIVHQQHPSGAAHSGNDRLRLRKADDAEVSEGSQLPPARRHPDHLRRIVDEEHASGPAEGLDLRDRRRAAVHVRCDDGQRVGVDRGGYFGRADIEVVADVDADRPQSAGFHGLRQAGTGVRGYDHRQPGGSVSSQRVQYQRDGGAPRIHRKRSGKSVAFFERLAKLRVIASSHRLATQHAARGRQEFRRGPVRAAYVQGAIQGAVPAPTFAATTAPPGNPCG